MRERFVAVNIGDAGELTGERAMFEKFSEKLGGLRWQQVTEFARAVPQLAAPLTVQHVLVPFCYVSCILPYLFGFTPTRSHVASVGAAAGTWTQEVLEQERFHGRLCGTGRTKSCTQALVPFC